MTDFKNRDPLSDCQYGIRSNRGVGVYYSVQLPWK